MGKTKKQIISVVIAAIVAVLGMNSGATQYVDAAVVKEVDISSGKKIAGHFSSDEGNLYYKFKAPDNGYVYFTLSDMAYESKSSEALLLPKGAPIPIAVGVSDGLGKGNMYWFGVDTLVGDRGKLYEYRFGTQEHMKKDGYEYLSARSVRKGDVLSIWLGKTDNITELYFKIQAHFKSYENVEKEKNDEKTSATTLKSGKKFLGVQDYKDDDWYKVKASKSGYFMFELKKFILATDFQTDRVWDVILYDSDLHRVYEEFSATDDLKIYCAAKKGDVFYIKIKNDDSMNEPKLYTIQAKLKATENVEKRNNDNFATATLMNTGKTYYGAVDDVNGDYTDYYSFKAGEAGTYKVAFSFEKKQNASQYFTVYDASKKEIVSSDAIKKTGNVKFKAQKGGTYYIKVSDDDSKGVATGALYKLKVAKVKK